MLPNLDHEIPSKTVIENGGKLVNQRVKKMVAGRLDFQGSLVNP